MLMLTSFSSLILLYTGNATHGYFHSSSIEFLTGEIAAISGHLLKISEDEENKFSISPMIPYALYQCVAASLQQSAANRDDGQIESVHALLTVLANTGQRWHISSKIQWNL